MIRLEEHAQGTVVPVRAQAGARRTGIVGEHDGALRIAVVAAPEKGQANKAIAKVLSSAFGIPRHSVELLSGTTSRRKRFLLVGKSMAQAMETVEELLRKTER